MFVIESLWEKETQWIVGERKMAWYVVQVWMARAELGSVEYTLDQPHGSLMGGGGIWIHLLQGNNKPVDSHNYVKF